MPSKWSKEVKLSKRKELYKLYVTKNKSISEIGKILNLADATIYDRLLRLKIKPNRSKKQGYNNINYKISIPKHYTCFLAEFIGIMLGDGHLNFTQVQVTLGNKEPEYVVYVSNLMSRLFNVNPKIYILKKGYFVVSFGSTKVVRWLLNQGLFFNKVKNQVSIPKWIFTKKAFMKNFLRGFFDTDGSVYKLRFGVQLSFINRSFPLLDGIRYCLTKLGYHPSKISSFKIYVTRKLEVQDFFRFISPANKKHQQRFGLFLKYYDH